MDSLAFYKTVAVIFGILLILAGAISQYRSWGSAIKDQGESIRRINGAVEAIKSNQDAMQLQWLAAIGEVNSKLSVLEERTKKEVK